MKQAILHTVKYFGYFQHPLTAAEVWRFLREKASEDEVRREVDELCAEGLLFSKNGYLHMAETEDWSHRRAAREQAAHVLLEKVPVYARIIASFPFVRSIAVSGSLSKLSVSENADIDYFIVTRRNRLWITRTLLHLFKKLTFLFGKQHCFCMNYFVDEDGLVLPYQNEFTAIELCTLIPFYNRRWVQALNEQNPWARRFLPNHDGTPLVSPGCIEPRFVFKPVLEMFFNLCFPGVLNRWLMRLTDWKWRRKFAYLQLREEDYQRAFYTSINTSKNHPADYQKKVLTALSEKVLTYAT